MAWIVALAVDEDGHWEEELKEFDHQMEAYVWAGDQVASRKEVKHYEVYHS